MVKKPSTRHSKSSREPVTIDLDASEPQTAASAGDKGQRGPATRAGDVYSDAKGEAAAGTAPLQSEPSLADETLVDTHADSPILHGDDDKTDQPAQSTSDMLHADRPSDAGDAEKVGDAPVDAGAAETSNPYETPAAYDDPQYEKPPVHPTTAASTVTPDTEKPVRRGAGFGSLLAAGLIGGALALGGSMLLDSSLRDGDMSASGGASTADIEALRTQVGELQAAQENAPAANGGADVSGEIEQLRTQIADLQQNNGGDGADTQALSSRVEELTNQVQQLSQNGGEAQTVDLQPVNQRIDALEQSVQAASQAADQAGSTSEQRLNELQQSLDALSQKVDERINDPRLALAITASALKAAIDRGQPFQTEFDAYVAAAPNAPEADTLRDMAATGVPTRAEISAELPEATSAMIAAGRSEPDNAGVISRLWSSATDLVEVRPVGANVQGNEPGAIVARLEAAVQAGDYERALAEYDTLPAASKNAGADFIAKVRARQAADDLVGKALSEALKA
ncbi:hypothetical protein JYU29_12940 [Tianweitania sp. BSSL-BM11]|uniref:Phage tail protein n=1 Tax=Tianweitania aestuarii TaxID=2814886 RepID=A0ABS5RX04_9HYPH|nr:hypothetical protein [Tianweitania aestuarii]MBS9721590.1 hypothetical protein [Tianweitania aestuarii]